MALVIGQNSGGGAQGYGIAAKVIQEKSTPDSNFNIDNLGPQVLDWLKTRLDLSMVRDSPYSSRYAVSGVDQGGVPLQPGSGGGGSGSGVISFNGRTGIVFPAKNDYKIELLSDTNITSPTNNEAIVYDSVSGLWINAAVMQNPMTSIGDMVYGETGGVPTRLPIGSSNQVLTVSGGIPAWEDAQGFSNPMTTDGDLIAGLTGGAPTRVGIGTSGQVLTATGGFPTWQTPSSGFTNPMTTKGDIIYEDATPTPNRLGIGTVNYGILAIAGLPQWEPVYSPLTPQPYDWGKTYMAVMNRVLQ